MTGASRPKAGVKFVVDADDPTAGGEVVYRGFAHHPDRDLRLEVVVALSNGSTRARVLDEDPRARELERVAAALVRAATKTAVLEHRRLPRRIARWRG